MSGVQAGVSVASGSPSDSTSSASANVNTVALSCATGVKMTEAQLYLIESALRIENAQRSQSSVHAEYRSQPGSGETRETSERVTIEGDFQRVEDRDPPA